MTDSTTRASGKKRRLEIYPKGENMAKSKAGRPPKYKTPQELETKIKEYFDSCWIDKITEVTDKEGNVTTTNSRYQDRPYTVAGLASFLGFVSRQSMWDYEQREQFSYLIKEARIKIEMNVEERLIDGKNATGPIFWLKNHADYRDRTEVEHDVSGSIMAAVAAKLSEKGKLESGGK